MDTPAPQPPSDPIVSLADCCFEPADFRLLQSALAKANGLILFCGPEGCGKTTSVYACAQHLAAPTRKIITIEPALYSDIPWATRLVCSPAEGLTLPVLIRSAILAEPDVMIVTELDHPVALPLLLRAALTRQLVISQSVADNPGAAILDLKARNTQPFCVSDIVRLVIAQRLVRRLCPECSEAAPLAGDDLTFARKLWRLHQVADADRTGDFRRPTGCQACAGTGYGGHRMITEFLPVSPAVAEAVRADMPAHKLRRIAFAEGAAHVAYDGLRKAAAGLTSIVELRQTVGADSFLV